MTVLEKKDDRTRCSNCGTYNRSTLKECWKCGDSFEGTMDVDNFSFTEIEVTTKETDVSDINYVVIKDINMTFESMIIFMLKWALASIPAIIILWLLGMFLSSIFLFLGALFL